MMIALPADFWSSRRRDGRDGRQVFPIITIAMDTYSVQS
jgi:hypothetical protein